MRRFVAVLCLLLAAGPRAQDIATLPLPRITSRAIATRAQSFDQPAAGARSPRNASYEIDVRLDHAARTLTGRQTLRWRNISTSTASELQFHLYWNAWRNAESTWMRERQMAAGHPPLPAEGWGAIDIQRLTVGSADVTASGRFIAPDDGNEADRTVLSVPLPAPVAPNESIEVGMAWTAKVPRPFARTGSIGNYYFIAQWFPKIGVLEDQGWNTHQFHAGTEFYADFGVYDVRLTVPTGWVVGASGREVGRRENGDGTTTHTYHGEDIHDFAWTTSPDFLVATQTFEHPSLPPVEMRLLLRPEHAGQEQRHFDATRACLRYYGEWFGAYPYGHITIVDPAFQSASGGMEYPTLFTAGTRVFAPERVTQPEAVTIHEAGHQFWYGMVANNEFEHAWMDEGLDTFATARTLAQAFTPHYLSQRYFGGFVPWVFGDIPLRRETDGNRLAGYREAAASDVPSTPSYRYWPASGGAISYDKTALWLNTLENLIGWPSLQRGLAAYFQRWQFRHPKPEDLFAALTDAAGRDLTWFFDEVHRSAAVFDYGVQAFASEAAGSGYRTTVVAARLGDGLFPVDVVTTFRDGHVITERWDGRDRRTIFNYERAAPALTAQVDPQRVLLLDVDVTNNSRTLEPRTDAATLKWSLAWMVWMQDLLLTYGFFV